MHAYHLHVLIMNSISYIASYSQDWPEMYRVRGSDDMHDQCIVMHATELVMLSAIIAGMIMHDDMTGVVLASYSAS